MKKLFSKTVAALLSVTCMGSVMTASFNGRPLFTPKLIAEASSGVSFDEETGVLTLYGNIENMFALANYSGDKRVKEVKALKGTVLPADCTKLFCRLEAEKIDISNADTSHVTNMSDMFSCCSNLKYLNIDNIDTSNVTNMNQTFYACPNLKSINLQSFNTSNVTDMMNMFNQCSSLETLDLRGFNTSNVTNMACMFSSCTNLNSIDMSTWNTCNLEHMNGMFQGCQNLKSLDFESFNTKELKSFNYVFSGCKKLEKIEFGDFDTSNITNMDYLFFGCSSIPLLDLSSFDTSKVTTMLHMFDDCQSLETIYVSDKWTTASLDFSHWTSIEYDRFMFFNCKNLKGGNGTDYDFNKTRSIMACIDTKETPGYLTMKNRAVEKIEKPYMYEAFIKEDLASHSVPNGRGSVNSYNTGDLVRVYEIKNNWIRISYNENKEEWIHSSDHIKVQPLKAVVLKNTAVKKSIKDPQTKAKSFDLLYNLDPTDDDNPITVYPVNSGKWVKISKDENKWIQLADLVVVPLSDTNNIAEPYQITLTSNQYTRNELGKRIKIYPKGYSFTIYAEDKGWGRISKENEPQEWVCLSCIKKDIDKSIEDLDEIIPTIDCLVHTPVDEGKITTFATCQKEGKRELKCRYCRKTYTEAIPRTEHKYDYRAVEGREPTRSEGGIGQKYCTICGDTLGELTAIPSVDIISGIDANDPLVFNCSGDAVKYGHNLDEGTESPIIKYTTVTYNNHEVIELKFRANYSWSITVPEYINIHDKDTCQAISSGDMEKAYTLYIWMDNNKYYESVIQAIKNENYSKITFDPEIIFHVQGENYIYQIDLFNINHIPANEYYESIKEYSRLLKCNNNFDAIDYLCGKSLTNGQILVFDYDPKTNTKIAISSSLDDKRNIRVDYLIFDSSIHLSENGTPLLEIRLSLLKSKGMYIMQAPNAQIINTQSEIKEIDFDLKDRNYINILEMADVAVKIFKYGVGYKVSRTKLSPNKSFALSLALDKITEYGTKLAIDALYEDPGAIVSIDEYSFAINDICEMIEESAIKVVCYDENLDPNAIIEFLIVDSKGQTYNYRYDIVDHE